MCRVSRFASAVLLALVARGSLAAQQQPTQSQTGTTAPDAPRNFFSGQIFGAYRTDSAPRLGTVVDNPNQFTIQRAYLTFRLPAGARATIRVTTDIFSNGTFGMDVRLKYGYLEYNFAKDTGDKKGWDTQARIGMIYTPVIVQEEVFWPRYLGQVGVERYGFFASSDQGAGVEVTLPRKLGSFYGTVVNGPGYTSPEVDRFKDVVLRATITPFGRDSGFLSTIAISPWIYKGYLDSQFAVADPNLPALKHDRWGVFGGVIHPKVVVGGEYARRTDGFEAGANTRDSPRIVTDTTGELLSGYAEVLPFAWKVHKDTSRLGVVVRLDRFKPRTNVNGSDRLIVAGVVFKPTRQTALALDYQGLTAHDYRGPVPVLEIPTTSWYLHWSATF